ncbi:MAG: flippase-like domain-containing protein [Gammaproteobacteria bacterium]|nr:flippase-like domain-containing protein [Gammaproteobacteria bacterium]
MKVDIKLVLGLLVFLGCVIAVQIYYGWDRVLAPWLTVAPGALLTTLILTFISYALRSLRVYDYFHIQLRGRFMLCFKLTLQHNLLNNLLPMRTGEISFPVLMARYFDVSATTSVPVLFWFRLMDLHALVAIALLAVGDAWLAQNYLLPVTLLWLLLPLAAYLAHNGLARKFASASHGIKKYLAKILTSLPQTPREFWRAWLWTWINWLVKLGVFAWVFQLFAPVSWSVAGLAAIAGDITSVLPFHGVAGAGTYEAGIVAALLPFNIAPEIALAAAVNLHLFLLGSTLLGGLVAVFLPGRVPAPRDKT